MPDAPIAVAAVEALAPDAAAAAAGRKLSAASYWRELGRNDALAWGLCQGSAVYQVAVEWASFQARCTCPSRKRPCKHVLGLLYLTASTPDQVPHGGAPADHAAEWLAARSERAEKAAAKTSAKPAPNAEPSKAAAKSASQRGAGIEQLQGWLVDLIRGGFGNLDRLPANHWEAQAQRLSDAKAKGLAGRLRRLAELPGAGAEWPRRLLGELGKLALLCEAAGRLSELPAALQADVRSLIGHDFKKEEVLAHGDHVIDVWLTLGVRTETEDRGQTRRTWLRGLGTGRPALLLDFSFGGAPFPQLWRAGTRHAMELAFWPSAAPLRALLKEPGGPTPGLADSLAGSADWAAFHEEWGAAVARQPWLERFPCALAAATPTRCGEAWWLADARGAAEPLVGSDHWLLAALSGGTPLEIAGEWTPRGFRPLLARAAGAMVPLGAGDG